MGTPQEKQLSTAYKTVRRKFVHSILRWSADDSAKEEVKLPNPPDVGDLVNILRSIGFKLRHFDKCERRMQYSMSTSTSSLNSVADGFKNAECRVEITCGHSGLRAILESVVGECRCPPIESATQAEFWQISGSAPVAQGSQESISSVQEAGSSLVPPLAPEVAAVVKDVMIRVLHITSDPGIGELDTSRHSLPGNTQPYLSHHRSLDILPLTSSSTSKQFGSTTVTVEISEQDNKNVLPRTVSNMELSTCSVSPVSRSDSAGDLMKLHETWDTTTHRQSSSPTSILSGSLERMSLTEKHGIFCRLEFAKRSINEAMSMLKVQPLPVDNTCKKVRVDNTSTPSSQAKKSGLKKISVTPGTIRKSPVTPGTIRKSPVTPGTIKKSPGTPGIIKKMPGTMGHVKKTSGSSGSIKKISGTLGTTKRTSAIPGPSSSVTQSRASAESLLSERAEPPLPRNRKLSATLSRPRMTPSPQKTYKLVSSGSVSNSQKLDVPSGDATVHTPSSAGTNISTGSSSSASSASSTKARKLINAVRRVSRISSSGGTPNSKFSQKENN